MNPNSPSSGFFIAYGFPYYLLLWMFLFSNHARCPIFRGLHAGYLPVATSIDPDDVVRIIGVQHDTYRCTNHYLISPTH